MKTFNVVWEERMSVNVEAKSEEEAVEMIHEGNYDTAGEAAEISMMPEAYEMEMKGKE